jgi:hypothetical protein
LGDEESALKRARGNDGKKETPGCLGVADGDVPMFSIPRRSEWAPTAQQLECMQSNTQVWDDVAPSPDIFILGIIDALKQTL